MRQVPPALAAHLDGRATTLCFCWRLKRADGRVFGFTDHDATLRFEDTSFEAASGLSASEAEAEMGLAAATQEVSGALSSLSIEERDIVAGRFDGASVETFLVNWANVEERLLLDVAEIGEVKRSGASFAAELRGLASRLDRVRGRLYRRRCDAQFGDGRCKVDAAQSWLRADASVAAVEADGTVRLAGAGGIDFALFSAGDVMWTSGAAAGLSSDIDALAIGDDGALRLAMLGAPPLGLAAGDGARLRAGCDKLFATCRDRFGNAVNFRGFPHLPGNDVGLAVAKKDGRHDGSPVVP